MLTFLFKFFSYGTPTWLPHNGSLGIGYICSIAVLKLLNVMSLEILLLIKTKIICTDLLADLIATFCF